MIHNLTSLAAAETVAVIAKANGAIHGAARHDAIRAVNHATGYGRAVLSVYDDGTVSYGYDLEPSAAWCVTVYHTVNADGLDRYDVGI